MASSAKAKGECWRLWFGTLKENKAIHVETNEQTLGKQMLAGPCRDNGTQRNFNKQTLLDASLSTIPISCYDYLW